MADRLTVASEAAQDIDEAYGWYECRRPGLGEDFLSSVDACIQAICRKPEMHAKIHENCRRGLVRRFPFAVFYEYNSGEVIVYCVLHTARDSQKWRERLP
jgi:plasmid stabilization system protein ParE